MRNWTEAHPGRLEAEVEAFNEAQGLDFELDQAELQATGRVVFRGSLTREGRAPVMLEVRYPESFPYLRPEVFAPQLQLQRHQNPYRQNLCLLERSTRHWSPSKTGAWLVSERVPLLLDLVDGDPEDMRRQEAPQGEPASQYFPFQEQTAVFIPPEMLALPDAELAGRVYLSVGGNEQPGQLLRACLTRVGTKDRPGKWQELARTSGPLMERFSKTALEGRWVRLERLPEGNGTAQELYEAARAVPGFEQPPAQNVPDGRARILGVVCKEEVRQGEWEDSWLFAVELTVGSGKQQQKGVYVTRGERLSPQDLGERIPTLKRLPEKRVALVGLGALGGPTALELARAQVGELRILDNDTIESGTIVRWPFGLSAVGHRKTRSLQGYISNDYPFTSVRAFDHHIGLVPAPGEQTGRSESELLTELLDGADIVVDASAEVGVQQLLAALADEAGIPQVYVWATEGGWGGAVARVVPGETGCWYCLQKRLGEKSIEPPPLAETGTVQPRGCTAPTWTGTSFDALPLVAQAARTVSFTLLGGRAGGHVDDVFICDQKAETAADLTAPVWKAYPLEPHSECPYCGGDAGR